LCHGCCCTSAAGVAVVLLIHTITAHTLSITKHILPAR
jgi:hypothetical protein